ncbi:pentapeptide repeat-containing protein [Candidatus Magnetomonas plexicatena]|uniref:pentapeptide repeat-containing protein n=1 Tax=Candidatus Magnetomonas plexicatena TaxID=2552947 RepID=UPI001C78692E|nr:pentapeptide repeat-containing protein [Nitrospirales bacterium LBB_01]
MIFIAFLAYVLVIVVGTTDRMLVMPDSTVKLPILGADVPVKTFYSITPLIVWILHLNLFLNIFFHAKKVYKWAENPETENEESHPFMFNFKIKTGDSRIVNFLLALILYFLYYIAPLVVLVWVNLRFLPYHSYIITGIHHWITILDSLMSLIFLTILIIADNRFKKYNPFSLKAIKFSLKAVKHFLNTTLGNFFKKGLVYFLIIVTPVGSLTVLKIPETNDEKFPLTSIWPLDKITIKYRTLYYITISSVIHRNLEVFEEKFLLKEVSDTIIVRYLSDNNTKEDAERDFSEGIDLKDRDLRFGNFERAVFLNADFRGAKIDKANFRQANLQGANFDRDLYYRNTSLQGANLWNANLQGAYLSGTNLQGAHLQYANLQGAHLGSADLVAAQLQGADLGYVNLQGAYLNGASLKCADLRNANLNGIYFSNIDMEKNLDNDNLTKIERSSAFVNIKSIIKSAKERCAKFDDKDKNELVTLLQKNNNLTEFITVRSKLACESPEMAKAVLSNMEWVKTKDNKTAADKIRKNMGKKCPDVFYRKVGIERREF